jgi:hypothetical protein
MFALLLYLIGCGLIMASIAREDYPTIYPLCFPMAYIILTKTKMPAWLKIVAAIITSILTIGSLLVMMFVTFLFIILIAISELCADIRDLFD